MAKRKTIRPKKVSNGTRKSISNKHRFDLWTPAQRALFKLDAKAKRKRTCVTIPNPDTENTSMKFIRVCTNG